MGNRVTIKDVAREANVSIKTVSNVLNDTGSMRPDTRRRVEEVMRKLGYTVNISARAMRSGGLLDSTSSISRSRSFLFSLTRSLNTQKNAITV